MRPKNHWKPWTPQEERRLVQLAEQKVPTHMIAIDLNRSVNAIRNKARSLGVALPLKGQLKRNEITTTLVGNGNDGGQADVPYPTSPGGVDQADSGCAG